MTSRAPAITSGKITSVNDPTQLDSVEFIVDPH